MGILNYYPWVVSHHENCLLKSNYIVIDHLYFDINNLYHQISYSSNTEYEFVTNLYKRLDHYLNLFYARLSISICIDGTPPNAKIKLQKERRMDIVSNLNNKNIGSVHLTPCTKFMKRMEKYIDLYMKSRDYLFKHKERFNGNKKFRYNIISSTKPGEGEVKVMNEIISNNKDDKSSHLIIGNDSDIIVMCMSTCIDNLYVYSTTTDRILSINTLHEYHRSPLDYACISLLLGNDYLPRLMGVSPKTLYKSYNNSCNIIYDEHFNSKELDLVDKGTKLINRDVFINLLKSMMVNVPKQWNRVSHNILFSNNDKEIENYIYGLSWCLNMYTHGTCKDYSYECIYTTLDKKFYILQIYLYVKKLTNEEFINIQRIKTYNPVNTLYYSLFVMPKSCVKLLSEKQIKLSQIHEVQKIIYDQELCDICIGIKRDINMLKKKILKKEKRKEDTDIVRCDCDSLISKLTKHKRTHYSVEDKVRMLDELNLKQS